jgi:hypothetical protein
LKLEQGVDVMRNYNKDKFNSMDEFILSNFKWILLSIFIGFLSIVIIIWIQIKMHYEHKMEIYKIQQRIEARKAIDKARYGY